MKAPKIFLILFVVLINTSLCMAECSEGQININTASAEELDKLYGIGPAKADSIIKSRPFESVDELINVSGIGEKTLNKIKEQGLACVADEKNSGQDETEKVSEKTEQKQNTELNLDFSEENNSAKQIIPTQSEMINLNPKDIKSDESSELKQGKAIYPLIFFCILLGFLFLVKKIKSDKNEFAE